MKVMQTLTPREEFVLRLRYGLNGKEHKLIEIAEKIDRSLERVRQIHEKALRKLRHPTRLNAITGKIKMDKFDQLAKPHYRFTGKTPI
jgi:RNA polymerase primary sigma factor